MQTENGFSGFNFPPQFVGFNDLFHDLKHVGNNTTRQYPPHNLIKCSDEDHVLELAVAGYTKGDLEILLEDNVLTVRTTDDYETDAPYDIEGMEFLHKEISSKRFTKSFTLHDHIRVNGADITDGILVIKLKTIIPEDKKSKRITIG